MNISERNAEIVRLRQEGVGPREIARRVGQTPNVVAGVLHRASLSGEGRAPPLAAMPPKARVYRRPRTPRPPSERRLLVRKLYIRGLSLRDIATVAGIHIGGVCAYVKDLPRRREITWTSRRKPDAVRLEALTALAAGETWDSVSHRLGHAPRSMLLWRRKQPDLWAEAQRLALPIIAEREAADAAAYAEIARLRVEEQARRAAEVAAAAEINAPILASMSLRHRAMMAMRLEPRTLKEVGDTFDVTRERVRQIEVKYRLLGLVVLSARPLSEASEKFRPSSRPRGRPCAIDPWEQAHAILQGRQHKRVRAPYNISDEERQRRRDRMARVSAERWAREHQTAEASA